MILVDLVKLSETELPTSTVIPLIKVPVTTEGSVRLMDGSTKIMIDSSKFKFIDDNK